MGNDPTFSNITFKGRGNGINIDNPVRYLSKKWNDTGFLDLRDLVFTNFVIETERCPIRIYAEKGVKLKYIGGMTFSDFRIKSKQPILLQGNPETVITALRFSEITLETPLMSEFMRVMMSPCFSLVKNACGMERR